MKRTNIRSGESGKAARVIVPVELLRELVSEWETGHLLSSEAMRKRLLRTQSRQEGISFEMVCKKLRI